MLKKFFFNFLSSFIGAWVALVLFVAAVVAVTIGIVTKAGMAAAEPASVGSHSVLVLDLSGPIEEIEEPADVNYMTLLSGGLKRPKTLHSIVKALGEAKVNKNIDALYIKMQGVAAAPATLNAVREAVIDFKSSGKKVVAYGDAPGMGDMFVASVADSIFVNPGGEVVLKGISGTTLYMKGLFDKLGVSFQVVKVGTFKSAVEPYILSEMSGPARAQLDTLYGNMWRYITEGFSSARRGLTPEGLDSLVNRDLISYAPLSLALDHNLIDATAYERVMDQKIADIIGVKVKKLRYVSIGDMLSQTDWGTAYESKHQIAVLYASGEIVDGAPTGINYEKLVPQIVELADNDKVKAMVLRVNSPGGSAFGSEQIGEALDYFKSKGKKLAVSMGDYAASGGYWISCGADMIFADPLTITGSIGIFGLIPNVEQLIGKIGVNPQTVSTTPDANFPTLYKEMNPRQREAMQAYVERGYDKFISRVASGRKMSKAQVLRIAEGRVWDAQTARRIGLVDSLGSLQRTIEWTASASGMVKEYDVAVYPRLEPSFWDMLPDDSDLFGLRMVRLLLDNGLEREYLRAASAVLERKPVQARMMPVEVRL